MDGAVVWKGSYCTNYCNPRGVNTLMIDPFTCSVLQSRRFDTHALNNASAELSNYLQTLDNGSVIVGVTADESIAKLHRVHTTRSTLLEFGVEVAAVCFGGSFAFITQKGYPTTTVLRKVSFETESIITPARLNAVITGTNVNKKAVLSRRNRVIPLQISIDAECAGSCTFRLPETTNRYQTR